MATNRFLNTMNIQPMFLPGDTTPAANSDWISMENYASVVFTILLDDGTATTDDLELTVRQATTNTGTGEKDVTQRDWWVKSAGGNVDASGSYSLNSGTDYELPGENTGCILVEIGADELDVAGGFKFISIEHDNGTGSKIIAGTATLLGPRYAVSPDEWPAVNS